MRSDPPSGFFDIVRDKYIELFDWNDDWEDQAEPSLNKILSEDEFLKIGTKLDYTR